MEFRQLMYKNSSIGYYRFGSGPKLALCFHGYGEDAAMFGFLGKYAGNQYTFYSIDLPFHGKTEWTDGPDFTSSDLRQIIEEILQENQHLATSNQQPATSNQQPPTTNQPTGSGGQLSLLGFSLGGRIALSLYMDMPERVEKIILLAPDGLKVNSWYWLATQTWLGNKFFAFTMKKPGWFFGFLKILNKLNLVNASIFKFVNYYIGDPEVRRLLYTRWTTLRKLKPELDRVKKYILSNKTQVRLIYGKHDRIILASVGEKFKKGIEEYCTLTVIPAGHQVLHEKHAEDILPALLH